MFADTGIPLLAPVIVLGWFALIPVVLLETVIAIRLLRWRFGFGLWRVGLANTASMILGMPITWIIFVVAEVLFGGGEWGDGSIVGVLRNAAWLGPGYIPDLGWAVPLALIVLCVPCFFVSWFIEYGLLCALTADDRIAIRTYAWKANLASYAMLIALLIGSMVLRL